MTTSSRNYNVLALRGHDIDDMEYVEEFGLDPSLAYTPEINKAMLDMVELQNYHHYTEDGMKEAEARTMAKNERMSAQRDIDKLMRKN